MPEKKLLTSKDVTHMLSISTVTLWRLVKDGEIPRPLKLAGQKINYYRKEWIDDFIDKLEGQR